MNFALLRTKRTVYQRGEPDESIVEVFVRKGATLNNY